MLRSVDGKDASNSAGLCHVWKSKELYIQMSQLDGCRKVMTDDFIKLRSALIELL